MIAPKEIQVMTQAGEEKTYIIHKIPAIPAREIVSQYPLSAMPKLGDYKVNEQIMFKMMAYVAVPTEGAPLFLKTAALINNHIPDWETLARVEAAMIEYNVSFFQNGKISTFLETFIQKLPQLISKIATASQAQSSPKGAPPSTN